MTYLKDVVQGTEGSEIRRDGIVFVIESVIWGGQSVCLLNRIMVNSSRCKFAVRMLFGEIQHAIFVLAIEIFQNESL